MATPTKTMRHPFRGTLQQPATTALFRTEPAVRAPLATASVLPRGIDLWHNPTLHCMSLGVAPAPAATLRLQRGTFLRWVLRLPQAQTAGATALPMPQPP